MVYVDLNMHTQVVLVVYLTLKSVQISQVLDHPAGRLFEACKSVGSVGCGG